MEVKSDFKLLEKILKNLKGKHYVDIGILGEQKMKDGASIAGIGAVHEFGSISKNIPERSFIKMPIEQNQSEIAKDVNKNFQKNIETGNIKQIFTDIGISAEAQIQDAFDTSGFGQWQDIKQETKDRKGSDSILIDEGTLRKAITSKAV